MTFPSLSLFFHLQYGEEEVCSDRLDTDFPDIDLSQLDTSDFDSVNCLSELQWCNDQQVDVSSIHYSTADELFEVSLDGYTSAMTLIVQVIVSKGRHRQGLAEERNPFKSKF